MGLFDFVKEAGANLFGGGAKAKAEEAAKAAAAARAEDLAEHQKADALRRLVTDMGFRIDGLDVAFDDGKATVRGKVASQADREKIVLLVGNTQGVGQVDDRMVVEKPEPESTMYTVQRGDTLSKIAKAHYGDAMKYMVIFEANKPMLKDPDKIFPGQALRIPKLG